MSIRKLPFVSRVIVSCMVVFATCIATVSYAQDAPKHSAVTPVEQDAAFAAPWWKPRHEAVVERVKQGNVGMIFIGDSITHFWEPNDYWKDSGAELWAKHYAPRNAVNMGFAGDQTQHVLWRLDHGEIDGISPKLAVIMIGTNNYRANTAEEIADGIAAIVEKLRAKLPETKVLLLAIFPRGEKPSADREKLAKASKLAADRVADGKNVHFLDFGDKFLGPDGTMSKEIMSDFLHPGAKGYAIWAEAIEPKVKELMGE